MVWWQRPKRFTVLNMLNSTDEKVYYFFVDESGDPIFYDRYGNLIVGQEGCSKILILGMIRTSNPKAIREVLNQLKIQISTDKYLQGIPSLSKSLVAFHATDDCPEVRQLVFKAIAEMDIKVKVYVARKIETLFRRKYHAKENLFYDDLVIRLFEDQLHLVTNNKIYFAVRGNRIRQQPMEEAIKKGIQKFEEKWNKKVRSIIDIQAQTPSGEPCLQVIDYINWAVYRAFIKKEMRFFETIRKKVGLLVDLFDIENYPRNFYDDRNPFDIKKISPL
ncbi:MAG: DUF3800 domain-containing protein [bacterium]|nr:DUF3800 domain-containing protein [bacterium]